MKGETLLLNHVGCGDLLICNGLVRQLCLQIKGRLVILAKHDYLEDARWMFKDLISEDKLRIHMLSWMYTYDEPMVLRDQAAWDDVIDISGYSGTNRSWGVSESFDQSYYKLAGVDFEEKWDGFRVEMPQNALTTDSMTGDFALVHDDPARGFRIDRRRIEMSQVNVGDYIGKGLTIFHFMRLIRHAAEIHVIDSAFLNAADLMETTGKLVWHQYTRSTEHCPTLKKEWEILK